MPVYLFTFHAFGSWMPDRPRGYVRRGEGVQPSDPVMAKHYRARQSQPAIKFNTLVQESLIRITQEACDCQSLNLHAVATDASHIHILVSWTGGHLVARIRQNIKQSLTRRLNERLHRAKWFSRGASQKRVADRKHFDHLMKTYLPNHRGRSWFEGN